MEPFVNDDETLKGERIERRYIRVKDAAQLLWVNNPKLHDIGATMQSIERYGFVDPPKYDSNLESVGGTLGAIVAGNGRIEVLYQMENEKRETPRGILLDSAGDWYLPIDVGIDAINAMEAAALAIDHNNLTLMGAGFSAVDMSTLYDPKGYMSLLNSFVPYEGALPVSLDAEDLKDVITFYNPPPAPSALKEARPNQRQLPLDMIYTLQMADCTCCLAVQAGLKYGINSAHYRLCPYTYELTGRHEVVFIDNEYIKYDHAKHVAAVKALKPKYATVRDVMSKQQCKEAGIAFYSLEQILEWADELSQYAENVIVIPKIDCLDEISEQYVLGYSVPSSHGGTPLPVEMFAGRRVHLLGGSWKAQLQHMTILGDDVVSVDNNQIALIASQWGQFVRPDGEAESLTDIGLGALNNPRYAALALSFGSIGAKVNELYKHDHKDAE